jgi:two-component system chemotaxis response regulator CheB
VSSRLNAQAIVRDLFAFGGSAGGLESLMGIVGSLPSDFPATVCVVLHRSPRDSIFLVNVLGRCSALPVIEPRHGDPVAISHIYVAPRDFHLTIKDACWNLDREPKQHHMRPAVDPLFVSAAAVRRSRTVGVVLSGGGADGVEGLIAIKAAGGLSLVQRPDEAKMPSMPLTAIREDDVDAALSTEEIGRLLPLLAAGCVVDIVGSDTPA